MSRCLGSISAMRSGGTGQWTNKAFSQASCIMKPHEDREMDSMGLLYLWPWDILRHRETLKQYQLSVPTGHLGWTKHGGGHRWTIRMLSLCGNLHSCCATPRDETSNSSARSALEMPLFQPLRLATQRTTINRMLLESWVIFAYVCKLLPRLGFTRDFSWYQWEKNSHCRCIIQHHAANFHMRWCRELWTAKPG